MQGFMQAQKFQEIYTMTDILNKDVDVLRNVTCDIGSN